MRENARRAWAAFELNRPKEAVRLAGLAIADNAHDADAYLVLAKALFSIGDAAEALAAADQAIVLAPQWARPYLIRFDILSSRGEHTLALAAADEAVRVAPKLAAGHMARGIGLRALGRLVEAVSAADEAVRLEPDNAHVLSSRGDISLGAQPSVAEGFYRRSLAIDPQRAGTLNNLGVALQNQGRNAEALLAYREALLVDPSMAVAQGNHAALARRVPAPPTQTIPDCPVAAPRTQTIPDRRVPYWALGFTAIAFAVETWRSLFPMGGPVSPLLVLVFGILVGAWWSTRMGPDESDAEPTQTP